MSASTKVIQAAAGNVADGAVEPVGIDFDGTNDYLSRASDLVGNSDGKEFTFSFWVYVDPATSVGNIYITDQSVGKFSVTLSGGGRQLQVVAKNASASIILEANTLDDPIRHNTWYNIIVSIDLSDTNKRHIYINDAPASSLSYAEYLNQAIDFTSPEHYIAANDVGNPSFTGRLAGVYLDYTYRDLSVEANRRDFIDNEGLYVTPPTSGIISVPMDDPDDPGRNDGTGGDFTLNGVVAQSGRGPNQYNAVASEFDGSNDYLSRASLTGAADGKQFTLSFNTKTLSDDDMFISFGTSTIKTNNKELSIWLSRAVDSEGVAYLDISNVINSNVNTSIQLTVQHGVSSTIYQLSINGVTSSGSLTWLRSDDIQFNTSYTIAKNNSVSASYMQGDIGEVYFDTAYIDLATDNPFWDSETGKPKPVRQVLEETGNTPLIAMPIRADDAGNNLGTGGDFTVNSGPYVGARGASEFWQHSAWAGSSGYGWLSNDTIFSGASSTRQFTIFFATKKMNTSNGRYLFRFYNSFSPNSTYLGLRADQGNGDYLYFNSESSGNILNAISGSAVFTLNEWRVFAFSVDLTDTNKRHVYRDRVSQGMTWSDYVNKDIPWSSFDRVAVFSKVSDSTDAPWNMETGPFYLSTEYVDFSQEANLNIFVDQLGNPRDLTSAIENELIPNPIIYLPFDDPTNLGKNLGTGSDFTDNSTVSVGGYVNG